MRTLEEAQERPSIVTGEVEAGGSLVVLECAYTHCRPCMQFVRQYEGVADKYLDTVFLRVIGDECPGAAHLCRDVLHVEGTPEFRFYRGGVLLHKMSGANKAKLEENVQSFLHDGEFGATSALPAAEESTSQKRAPSNVPR